MSIFLRAKLVDGPFRRDSTGHCQKDKKNRKLFKALENKEKHGIFEAALLCRPVGKFWIIQPSSHNRAPSVDTVPTGPVALASGNDNCIVFIMITPTRTTLIFQGVGVSFSLAQRDVKRVLIGYPNHALSLMYESHLYGENIEKRFHYYQTILPFEAYMELMQYNFDVIFSKLIHSKFYLEPWIVSQLFSKDISTIPFLGGFYRSYNSRVSLQSTSAMISRLFFNGEEVQNFSSLQEKYLSKLIVLLQSRGIEVVFINTPVHPSYYRLIPRRFLDMHEDYMNKLSRQYAVECIDLSTLELPDEFYGDGNHVNTFGAGVVSRHIDAWLKSINDNDLIDLNYFVTDEKINNNFFIGTVYYSYKKYRKALASFNLASGDNLKNEQLFFLRGNISAAKGRLEEAIAFYNKTLETNDKFEEAATKLSTVKKRMDIIAQQIQKTKKSCVRNPMMGYTYCPLGNYIKAAGS